MDKELKGFSNKTLANIDSTKNEEDNTIIFNTESNDCVVSYYIQTILNDKNFIKIIKTVERMVRMSEEYKRYLGSLRRSTNVNNCSFLQRVDDDSATIEFHHYPFTLYDIVLTVIVKKLMNEEMFSTFNIASDVIKLHFGNKVGLVALSKTMHEMTHIGKLFIPLESILCNYDQFITEYKEYFNNSMISKLNSIIKEDTSRKESNTDDKDFFKVSPLKLNEKKINLLS